MHVDQSGHTRVSAQIDDRVTGISTSEPLFHSCNRRSVDHDRHVCENAIRPHVDESAALQDGGCIARCRHRASDHQTDQDSHAAECMRCRIATQYVVAHVPHVRGSVRPAAPRNPLSAQTPAPDAAAASPVGRRSIEYGVRFGPAFTSLSSVETFDVTVAPAAPEPTMHFGGYFLIGMSGASRRSWSQTGHFPLVFPRIWR